MKTTSGPLIMILALGLAPPACSEADPSRAGADGGGAEAGIDATPDSVADLAADVVPDLPVEPFVAIAPCLTADSFVRGQTEVVTAGPAYSPPCLRVPVGTTVTIDASSIHPLEPRPGGSPGSPISARFAPSAIVFPSAGFYPFQCPEHIDEGMRGVIWVSAAP